jgi:hypothetical protein
MKKNMKYADMYGSLSEFVQTFDIDGLNAALGNIKYEGLGDGRS